MGIADRITEFFVISRIIIIIGFKMN